jgi:hypothetical protein
MQCGPNCPCVCGGCKRSDCGCFCHNTVLDDASTETIGNVLASFGVTVKKRTTMYIHVKNHSKQAAVLSAIKKAVEKKRISKTVRKAVGSVDADKVKSATKQANTSKKKACNDV